MNPYKDKDLRKFIESIPQEEVDRQTRLQAENNARVYKEFTDGLKIGKCFLCGVQMDSFEEGSPCFHWFTYPTGIKRNILKTKNDFKNKIINNALWGEDTVVTDELVAYYKAHPEELDLIIDKEYFYGRYIKFFFILGIVITVLSRVLKFAFEDTWAVFINEVILDIFSELGIAIFGGAITTLLLEKMNQKQYNQNIALRKEILEKMKQSKTNA